MDDQRAVTILDLHTRLLTLKLLPRTGWLQRGMTNVESIADHSFSVAMLALLIGDLQPDLDRSRLLTIALLHDIAEVFIGDLPASARRLFGAEAKREAERRSMQELLNGLPQATEYIALWTEYIEGSSREARLVKTLDRIEMLVQTLAYERAGHRALDELWDDLDWSWGDEFPLIHSFLSRLLAERFQLNGKAHINGAWTAPNGDKEPGIKSDSTMRET
ncbi:MAG: HD domain-containing protein [Chloroflexales bacterium]|nr:HD domain-containing protein [Chloroflexales bacterium]